MISAGLVRETRSGKEITKRGTQVRRARLVAWIRSLGSSRTKTAVWRSSNDGSGELRSDGPD